MDLYRLVTAYLWDESAREKMNELVRASEDARRGLQIK
jgi:hypothetical protein